MFPDVLLPGSAELELEHLDADASAIILTLHPTRIEAPCPCCTQPSSRIHARYRRTLADRPWAGVPVRLHLRLRKFVCRTPSCPQTVFVERLPTVVAPFAQRSLRLADDQRHLALEHGGEAGARTAARTGMPTSPDTLLRLARRTPSGGRSSPTIIGVDDWAFRKGHTYGTVIVDLEAHQVIELLPDRTATTLETWLKEHPEVKVISRDRAGAYAEGARNGAPEAVQVADRFHLLQNLREALQRLLDRHHTALQAIRTTETQSETAVVGQEEAAPVSPVAPTTAGNVQAVPGDEPTVQSAKEEAAPARPLSCTEQQRQDRRHRRRERYEAVVALHQQDLSVREIARRLHLSRQTVVRYLATGTFPEHARPQRQRSILDPFLPYLHERWLAGCDNGMQLWREISKQGYGGSRGLVSHWVAQQRGRLPMATVTPGEPKRRGRPPTMRKAPPDDRSLSARRAAWLLIRWKEEMTEEDQALLQRLTESCDEAAIAYGLAQSFRQMARERDGAALDSWLEAVEESGLPDLKSFAAGLRRDEAAVRAGLSLPWSQGQVEGQVNRLKLIKRSGYGRAKFDLLRQRVLAA